MQQTKAMMEAERTKFEAGGYLVLDNPDWSWWFKRSRDGFLQWIIEEGYPVKILIAQRTLYFGSGLTMEKVTALSKELYGKTVSGKKVNDA